MVLHTRTNAHTDSWSDVFVISIHTKKSLQISKKKKRENSEALSGQCYKPNGQ